MNVSLSSELFLSFRHISSEQPVSSSEETNEMTSPNPLLLVLTEQGTALINFSSGSQGGENTFVHVPPGT